MEQLSKPTIQEFEREMNTNNTSYDEELEKRKAQYLAKINERELRIADLEGEIESRRLAHQEGGAVVSLQNEIDLGHLIEQLGNKLNEKDQRIEVLERQLEAQREINQERVTEFERKSSRKMSLVKSLSKLVINLDILAVGQRGLFRN